MQGPDVYNVLKGKNIHDLYHANTVTTSCTFLKLGGLASRGYVADLGLPQTSQYTDAVDQKYKIWYEVFTDTVDIHDRTGRVNWYGPVLFVLSVDILKALPVKSEVLVTKKNPTKWIDGEPLEERFFTTLTELDSLLYRGTFDQMIVIRTQKGILPFQKDGVSMVVDDPQRTLSNGQSAYVYATTRIKTAAGSSPFTTSKRICQYGCKCVDEYKACSNSDFDKYFK